MTKPDICHPKTERDWEAARLYSTRRHLRDHREALYEHAGICLSRGDLVGWDAAQRKAWALEDRISAINDQLEAYGIW